MNEAAPAAEPRAREALLLGAVLAALVLSLQLPSALRVPEPWQSPALPAQALLPGLFHSDEEPRLPVLVAERPPQPAHLAQAALFDALEEPVALHDSVTPGFLGLLLGLFGLLAGRGGLALAGRVVLGAGVFIALSGLPVSDDPTRAGALLVLTGVGLLAGAGLARLLPRAPDGRGEGPAVALGTLAVVLAAVLVGLALHAGSSSDEALTRPLFERVESASARDTLLLRDPVLLAVNAAWLRAVLDRAALAAFAGLCALLLHLRSRGLLTGALLLGAVAADLLSVRLLL